MSFHDNGAFISVSVSPLLFALVQRFSDPNDKHPLQSASPEEAEQWNRHPRDRDVSRGMRVLSFTRHVRAGVGETGAGSRGAGAGFRDAL